MGEKGRRKKAPFVTASGGRDDGRQWSLAESDSHDIGRSSKNSIALRDSTVSKRHALLENIDGLWFISDLDSRHGTFVNGERVEKKKSLFPGDRIRIGESILIFEDA